MNLESKADHTKAPRPRYVGLAWLALIGFGVFCLTITATPLAVQGGATTLGNTLFEFALGALLFAVLLGITYIWVRVQYASWAKKLGIVTGHRDHILTADLVQYILMVSASALVSYAAGLGVGLIVAFILGVLTGALELRDARIAHRRQAIRDDPRFAELFNRIEANTRDTLRAYDVQTADR